MQKMGRMGYQEFQETVRTDLERKLGSGYSVYLKDVPKNNGLKCPAVCIQPSDLKAVPIVYLDGYYGNYLDGESLEQVEGDIINFFMENHAEKRVDIEWLTDFQSVKGKIVYQVVNYERNMEMLSEVPHQKVLDLAVIFYILFEKMEHGLMTVVINNSYLDLWGVTEDEIYQVAKQNTPELLPVKIMSMEEILADYQDILPPGVALAMVKSFMYTITNVTRIDGAGCILYEGALKEFADTKGCNLFIIPSSIHECIILPDMQEGAWQGAGMVMNDAIRDVNGDQHIMEERDILGDRMYYYDREKDALLFADEIGRW